MTITPSQSAAALADEREAFEKWLMAEQMLDGTLNPKRNCYDEFPCHLAFKAWQARATVSTAAPVGEPADEIERLRAFAAAVMEDWPDVGIEGADLQELGIKHGLLELKMPKPTEPCSENCNCAAYFAADEWAEGIECYRLTALVAAPRARELGNE